MAPRHDNDPPEVMLARIDERTESMETRMNSFVTKSEFLPVKSLVYGFAGLIFVYVVGKILSGT